MNKKIRRIISAAIIGTLILMLIFVFTKYNITINIARTQGTSLIVNVNPKQENKDIKGEQTVCTRLARYENKPRYDRALSLIQDRIIEHVRFETDATKFIYFNPKIVNCIKVIEVQTEENIEGYFKQDIAGITENYYPVYVNQNYQYADDLVTALLLSHELTHVQQYYDSKDSGIRNKCIADEVNAFIAQLEFYGTFNIEENSSIYSRINDPENPVHTQLRLLDVMFKINKASKCKFTLDSNNSCSIDNLRLKLTEALTQDTYYRKQCGL